MPAAKYAQGTTVGIGRSKDEIVSYLQALGATKRNFGEDDDAGIAAITFEWQDRRYRLLLPLPKPDEDRYRYTPARGYVRSAADAKAAWQQDCAERWRALAAYIKALWIGHQAGIIKIEEALLANVVLPTDETIADVMMPRLAEIASTGRMPPLLPAPAPRLEDEERPRYLWNVEEEG